jgi:NADPH-dependent F420 reductase
VVVLAVPPYHVADTVDAVSDSLGTGDVLVSPATGLTHDADGAHHHPPGAGSVTAIVADAAPEDVPVVGAFHSLPAGRLADLDAELDVDTPLVGDDPSAKDTVADLAEDIDGLHTLDAGGVANAGEVEALRALLLNVGAHTEGLDDAGVRFR